ncbi:MAG: YihY/virulence factor BrkB family protein [Pseudomonadota bacterium]
MSVEERIDRFIWGDTLERHGLPGRIGATVLRYLYAILRDVFMGQLTLRAMSLVYTTLLSIVPLLAFSFSVLKGFGVHEDLKQQMYVFLEPLGGKGVEITDQIMLRVENVNGGVLGGIGLAFFVYTAISMVQKVEESFNYVWSVSKPRSFARRFSEYTVVLLVGPLAIVAALGMIAPIEKELSEYATLRLALEETSKIMPYLLVAAVFAFLYVFMPNTRVRATSAIIGGLTGGFLWATVGVIFTQFIANSANQQAIYASFAVAIAALIWLYLNWIVLLLGAQVAYYHQNPAYLRIGRREPRLSNAMRERLALNLMFLIGRAFRGANTSETAHSLATSLRMPSITLAPVLTGLEKAGLVSVTERDRLIPGRDINRIRLNEILAVVRQHGETGSYSEPHWEPDIAALGDSLDAAVMGTISDRTLSDLLDSAENDKNR